MNTSQLQTRPLRRRGSPAIAPAQPARVPRRRPDLSPAAMEAHRARARVLRARQMRRTVRAAARLLAAGLGAAHETARRAVSRRARARRRRLAIRELESLSDRLLRDIGVERGRIPEVVDALLQPEGARGRPARTARHAPQQGRAGAHPGHREAA